MFISGVLENGEMFKMLNVEMHQIYTINNVCLSQMF